MHMHMRAAAIPSRPDRSERIKKKEKLRDKRRRMEKPLIGNERGMVADAEQLITSLTSSEQETLFRQLASFNATLEREAIHASVQEKFEGMGEEEMREQLASDDKFNDENFPGFLDKTLFEPMLLDWVRQQLDPDDSELLGRILVTDETLGGLGTGLLTNFPRRLRRQLMTLKPAERQGLPKLLYNLNELGNQQQVQKAFVDYIDEKSAIRVQRRREQKGLPVEQETEGDNDQDEDEDGEGKEEDDGWMVENESEEVRSFKALVARYYVLVEIGIQGDLLGLTAREYLTELGNVRRELQLTAAKGTDDEVVKDCLTFILTELATAETRAISEDLETMDLMVKFVKAAEAFYALREFYPALIEQQIESNLVAVDVAQTLKILEDLDRPRWWTSASNEVDRDRLEVLSKLDATDLVQLRFLSELTSSGFNSEVLLRWSLHPYIGPKMRSGNWFDGFGGLSSDLLREAMEEALASESLDV